MEYLPAILPLMVPILGILLGFVILAGIFIVQPVVKALTKLAERPGVPGAASDTEAELRALSRRMASLEETLSRLADERRFDAELRSGAADARSLEAGREGG